MTASSSVQDARRIPLGRPGVGQPAARTAEMLRVDHAGEFAAVHIYRAQRAVFEGRKGREAVSTDLTEMEGHEQVHLNRFEALLNERRVRPTAMTPVMSSARSASTNSPVTPRQARAGSTPRIVQKPSAAPGRCSVASGHSR